MVVYTLVIPALIYFLSGILDAVMDTIADHADISIFWGKKGSASWWLNRADSKYETRNGKVRRTLWSLFGVSTNKPVQFSDGWHFAKMLKELLNTAAPMGLIYLVYAISITHKNFSLELIIFIILGHWFAYGSAKNFGFGLFYNKILLRKQYRRRWLFI